MVSEDGATVDPGTLGASSDVGLAPGSVSHFAVAVIVADDAGHFKYISPKITRILGYTQNEVRELNTIQGILDCSPDELPRADRDDGRIGVERLVRDINGQERRLLVSVEHARLAGGTRLYTFCDVSHAQPADVSDHTNGESSGPSRNADLSGLKTQFLASLNHELRTPLAAILGYAELLEEHAEGEDLEYAQQIAQSGRGLLQSLTNILDFAQLENGEYKLTFEKLALAEEVKNAVRVHDTRAAEKGLTLRVDDSEARGTVVSADRAALGRVLEAVVSNAIKFTDHGGITVTVARNGSNAAVRVEDTGIGIDPSFLPHLFEGFRQESAGLGRDYEGSGVGLAIAKRLVQRMHGGIDVESRKGEGSAFTLRFPLTPQSSPAEAPASRPDPATSEIGSGPHVLVVEDNLVTRRILQRMLESAYHVDTAANPDEALALAAVNRYDALLLDINLGDRRTGVELLQLIRRNPEHRDVPAVACTAYALPGFSERLFEVGFSGYISKPFSKDMLLSSIADAMKREPAPAKANVGAASPDLDLPPLPTSLSEVVEMLSDESNADMERLTDVLSRDPVVAAWVLHHVNSAFHSLRSSVTTIDRAVTMLGFEPVCNLVLSKVLTGAFAGFETGRPADVYQHVLRTSVATAAYAQALAEFLSMPKPELSFTVGLMYELGRLGLLSLSPEKYADLWFDPDAPGADTPIAPPVGQELLMFGTDYVTVGVDIAREWQLPKDMIYVIGRNVRSEITTPTPHGSLALCVAAGAAASERMYVASRAAGESPPGEVSLVEILQALGQRHKADAKDLEKHLRQKEVSVREFVGTLVQ